MSKLHELANLGQSIWLDYIRRDMLESGELNQLHQSGVRGVTSNPSIFEQAIAQSDDYNDELDVLIAENKPALEVYEALAIEDIRQACDVFIDLYRQTEGKDGYVSLEVNPHLAHDTEGTIKEARRLFAAVDRPNLYIKVPATPEGIPAIRELISDGINVNVTLIFANSVYEQVADAYMTGLEQLIQKGGNPHKVSSVASFFVSRVDSNVDKKLREAGNSSLLGTIGIANARLAYLRFRELFSSPRWKALAERGARVQRPLWGSTSTKDPAYPDTLYVDSLIGPHTVNTVPPETLHAFREHGTVARTIDTDPEEVYAQLRQLKSLGIDLDAVTDDLLAEGVDKFAAAFDSLLQAIEERISQHQTEKGVEGWQFSLGSLENAIHDAVKRLEADDVLARLWQKDHTLWSDSPAEITNRLAWLDIANSMQDEVGTMRELAKDLQQEGIRQAVLLGMGGSSLAPELFAKTFDEIGSGIDLRVLDTTDPDAIRHLREQLKPRETVFIVSSKSGGTIETLSLFKYFYTWQAENVGLEEAGKHFIAITDEGSKLASLARQSGFRAVFHNNPDIGGRYSALSHFGLLPAALVDVDIERLLGEAQRVSGPEQAKRALKLGAIMGHMALSGRNKLTLITSPALASFGDWAEQLIAESTGKDGKGILPIVGEPLYDAEEYGDDRLFVYLRLAGGANPDDVVAKIREAGHPLVTIPVRDRYALGEQFMIWEVATAVAGKVLGIHPFNQPNVESAKRRANEMIAAYKERGSLPGDLSTMRSGGVEVQEQVGAGSSVQEVLDHFLDTARPGGYVAIHAYVAPSNESDLALGRLRRYVERRTGLAATVGYGPRFLHSTGQLHKGDGGQGLFIQLVSEPLNDLLIPEEAGDPEGAISFGVLKKAQALGDAKALKDAHRKVIRFVFGSNTADAINQLTGAI